MASKSQNPTPNKHVEGGGEKQALITVDEKPIHESYGGSVSDSETEEEEPTPMVPPEKPKLVPPRPRSGPEPRVDGSECSSPSASGFIIMPAPKKAALAALKKFSQEEEVALLKGLAVFWTNGRNNKWTEFHLFIKDDLPRQFTKIQVSEKIRALKRKFEKNMKRAQTNGEQFDFSDHHESLLFELSKKLWGEEIDIISYSGTKTENVHDEEEKKTPVWREEKNIALKIIKNEVDGGVEERNKMQKRKRVTEINKEFVGEYPLLCGSFDVFGYPKFAKDCCALIGKEKAQELEEKWRKINAEELSLELKKIDLIKRDLLDHHTSK